MSNCANEKCRHEWCDRNRTTCDALVPTADFHTTCGKPATWHAPLKSDLFPLSYCAEHGFRDQP